MPLREVECPPGAPWNRSLRGRLDVLTVESYLLAGNPLADPARRPLYVYLPPGVDGTGEYASVYVIQGFTGQLDMWLNRSAFEPTMIERLDHLFGSSDCPPAIVVFVDAWTSYGGSQFINSSSTGRYMDDDFEGSYEVFFERFAAMDRLDFERFGKPFEVYGYAACYSPDEKDPGKALLPFDLETGRLDEDVWERWLAWDPVRMAPEHGEALSSMRRIYLDAGKSDEWYLDLGALAFARELEGLGIEHSLDLFEGTHMGIQYRYPGALAELARTLSP